MPRATVEVILFDLGGVLVVLDGVPAMAKLLGLPPSALSSVEGSHDAIHKLWMTSASVVAHETGQIGAAEFAAGVVADLNLAIAPEAFLEDFCAWPSGLQPGALELLDAIPRRYRIAALSNISAVHWEKIAATGLASRFDRMFLSYEIGHLKPSPDAFLHAIRGLGVTAPNVLFIDDGATNVRAAAALGMQARLARNAIEARSVLADYGIVL